MANPTPRVPPPTPAELANTFHLDPSAGRITFPRVGQRQQWWDHGVFPNIDDQEDAVMLFIFHFVKYKSLLWNAAFGTTPQQQNQRLVVRHGWHNANQGGNDPRWHLQVYVENTVTRNPGTPNVTVTGSRVASSTSHIFPSGQQSTIVNGVLTYTEAG